MIEIPLSAIPNQSLSIRLGDAQYDLRLFLCNNVMAIDIIRDNEVIIQGARLAPGFPILPYEYLSAGEGNFVVVTENDEYPDYLQFGITQFLIYATTAELANLPASI